MAARAPAWTRDELILALDLYFRAGKARQHDPEVIALSQILRSARGGDLSDRSLRSPASVHLKLQNFLRFDPSYSGAGMTAGSQLEADVWTEFQDRPERLRSLASAIREIIVISADGEGEEEDEIEAPEGRLLTRHHRSRERARELVAQKKKRVLRSGKPLTCEACDFDFAARYGSRGVGFIECHHKQPLSSLAPGAKTKLSDLALVCSNCHSMLHRGNPWPSVDELRRSLARDSVP